MKLNLTTPVARGWAQALFSVLVLWGVNNVILGYSAQILHTNYLIYSCSAFVSCALFLLIIGGKGPLVKETLRSIDTWAFGTILLLGSLLTLSLFAQVSSTEGSMLQRISMLFSIVISWFFLNRTPTKGQLIGILCVLVGIAFVCADIPEEKRGLVYLLMVLEGLALTGRMFVAEVHRPHKHAMSLIKDPRAKARVIGFIMFIISTFFLVSTFILAALQSLADAPFNNPIIPNLSSFTHTPSIVAGMLAGVFLLTPLRLIEFSSASLIKTENFLALAALSSFATLFWEWLLHPITGMSLKSISPDDLLAGIIITTGCLIAAFSQMKKSTATPPWQAALHYAPQNIDAISDTREIIASTLEHVRSDVKLAAKLLNLHPSVITTVLNDTDRTMAFRPHVLTNVTRYYRRNVATADSLTGLANRSAFMAALKAAPYESESYSILFIDLDKFKPVNDTYGHDAGDAILKQVAKRLNKLFPHRCVVTRLGGDEFAVMLLDQTAKQAKAHAKMVQKKLAQPFNYQKHTIYISASVGTATYPSDATSPEALLQHADAAMYHKKPPR